MRRYALYRVSVIVETVLFVGSSLFVTFCAKSSFLSPFLRGDEISFASGVAAKNKRLITRVTFHYDTETTG